MWSTLVQFFVVPLLSTVLRFWGYKAREYASSRLFVQAVGSAHTPNVKQASIKPVTKDPEIAGRERIWTRPKYAVLSMDLFVTIASVWVVAFHLREGVSPTFEVVLFLLLCLSTLAAYHAVAGSVASLLEEASRRLVVGLGVWSLMLAVWGATFSFAKATESELLSDINTLSECVSYTAHIEGNQADDSTRQDFGTRHESLEPWRCRVVSSFEETPTRQVGEAADE